MKKNWEVTSGTQSPTLKKSIGLALIDVKYAAVDTEVEIEIRNKRVKSSSCSNTILQTFKVTGEGRFHVASLSSNDRRRQKEMLQTIGVQTIDELFSDIPESVRFKGFKIKEAKIRARALKELSQMASKNANLKEYASFLGAGVYDHYAPVIVDHVIFAQNFIQLTPYQPEISQGELQAIFEFQTMICELTGMDVANSSMYDGEQLAEAANVSSWPYSQKENFVSSAVHPESRAVLETYAKGQNLEVVEINHKDGVTDLDVLQSEVDDTVACVIVQYPNFFGQVEKLAILKNRSSTKSLFIVLQPLSLGALTPPGNLR